MLLNVILLGCHPLCSYNVILNEVVWSAFNYINDYFLAVWICDEERASELATYVTQHCGNDLMMMN